MSKKDHIVEKFAVLGAISAAVGFIAGTLTAPSSGKKTRQELKKNALLGKDQLQKELKSLFDDSAKVIKEAEVKGIELNTKTKEDVKELIAKADDNKSKIKEILEALKNGQEVSDADLKRAVESGKIAIEHLREFLKK